MTFDVAAHFALRHDPFGARDTHVVDSPALLRSLNELVARLDNGARWLAIEGMAGSGRTRLLRLAADALAARGYAVHLTTRAREIDPAVPADVLLVDEAELVPTDVAEAMADRAGAVVLALRPEGGARLSPPAPSVAIASLTNAEARAFLLAHVERAGGTAALFAPNALAAIVDAGEGSPRRLRRLAGLTMVEAALDGAATVEERHAAAAIGGQSVGIGGAGGASTPGGAARVEAGAAGCAPRDARGRDTGWTGAGAAIGAMSAAGVTSGGVAGGVTARGPSRVRVVDELVGTPSDRRSGGSPPPRRPRSSARTFALRTLVILAPVGLALAVAGPLLREERSEPPPPGAQVATTPPTSRARAAEPDPPPAAVEPSPYDPVSRVGDMSGEATRMDPPPDVGSTASTEAAEWRAERASAERAPLASAPDRGRETTAERLREAERANATRRAAREVEDAAADRRVSREGLADARRLESRNDDRAETASINRAELTAVERALASARAPRVFLHYWSYDAAAAEEVAYALRSRGWHVVALRPVSQRIRSPSTRFFRTADAAAARRLAADLGDELDEPSDLRDFTRYSRPSAPGTLEVWLPAGASG